MRKIYRRYWYLPFCWLLSLLHCGLLLSDWPLVFEVGRCWPKPIDLPIEHTCDLLLLWIYIFCLQQNTNHNFWSPIFLLWVRMKRRRLGQQWRFFRWRIRVNTNTLIIYSPTTEKPRRMNWMPAIYTVLCDCQMFQVNFIPYFVSTFWRRTVLDLNTAIWFFALFSKWSFLSHSEDDRRIAMLLAPGHNRAAFLVAVPWTSAECNIECFILDLWLT